MAVDYLVLRENSTLNVKARDGTLDSYRILSPLKVYFNEAKAYQHGERRGSAGQWGVLFFARDVMDIRIQLMNDVPVVDFYNPEIESVLESGTFVYNPGVRDYMAQSEAVVKAKREFKRRHGRSPRRGSPPRRS